MGSGVVTVVSTFFAVVPLSLRVSTELVPCGRGSGRGALSQISSWTLRGIEEPRLSPCRSEDEATSCTGLPQFGWVEMMTVVYERRFIGKIRV